MTLSLEATLVTSERNMTSAGGPRDPHEIFYLQARFVTGLVIYPIICVLGLSGNIVCIIVMTQKQMRSSTNVYLLSLAISDVVKLLSDLLYFLVVLLVHVDSPAGNKAYGFLYPYAHYVFNSSLCVSAWLTVSVAFERYVYVCQPAHVKKFCSIPRARAISFAVFISMSLVAVPYAMRYRTVERVSNTTGHRTFSLEVTRLWENRLFADVYTWVQNLLRSIIPLVILIILNVCIIYGIRRCRFGQSKSGRRHRITTMLIFVVLIFLVCIAPDAVMSTCFGLGYYEEAYLQRGVREITDMLLLVNSATNFVLYCIFNTIFRRNFVFLFCRPCRPGAARADESNLRWISLVGRSARSAPTQPPSKRSATGNNGDSPLLDNYTTDRRLQRGSSRQVTV